MVGFVPEEMQWRLQYGFRILLPAEDVLLVFREKLKLSRIAAVRHHPRQPEERRQRGDRLSLPIRVPSRLPCPSRRQHLPQIARTGMLSLHSFQQLSNPPRLLLRQRLKHHRRCQAGMQASGGSQTQIHPGGCWDALSPLWRIHVHAHRQRPR